MSKFLFLRKFKKFHSNSNFHLNPSILVAKNLKFIFLFTSSIRPSLQRQPILLWPFGQAVHWPCGLVWPIGTHPLPWAIMPLPSPASSAVPCPLTSRPPNWFRPLLYRNGCRLHHSPDSPPPLPKPKWPPWSSTCHRPLKPPRPLVSPPPAYKRAPWGPPLCALSIPPTFGLSSHWKKCLCHRYLELRPHRCHAAMSPPPMLRWTSHRQCSVPLSVFPLSWWASVDRSVILAALRWAPHPLFPQFTMNQRRPWYTIPWTESTPFAIQ
jgi:hypothetical protein